MERREKYEVLLSITEEYGRLVVMLTKEKVRLL